MSLGAYSNAVTEPVNKQMRTDGLPLDSSRVKLSTFGILGFVLIIVCSSAFAKTSAVTSANSNQKEVALYLQGPKLSFSDSNPEKPRGCFYTLVRSLSKLESYSQHRFT